MRWEVEFDNGGHCGHAEPRGAPGRRPVDAALPVGHLRPAARVHRPRQEEPPQLPGPRGPAVPRVDLRAACPRPGPDLPSIDGPIALTAGVRPAGRAHERDRPTSNSFWDEVERAPMPPAPTRSGPDGTVVRDNVSGLVRRRSNALFEAYRFYHRPGDQRPEFDPASSPTTSSRRRSRPTSTSTTSSALLADHPRLLRMLGLVVDLVVELDDPHASARRERAWSASSRGRPARGSAADARGRAFDLEDRWFGAAAERRVPHGARAGPPDARVLGPLPGRRRRGGAAGVGMGDVLVAAHRPGASATTRRRRDRRSGAALGWLLAGPAAARRTSCSTSLKDRRDLNDLAGARTRNGRPPRRGPACAATASTCSTRTAPPASAGSRCTNADRRNHESASTGARTSGSSSPSATRATSRAPPRRASARTTRRRRDDLYLHETVVSWDGWSLAAPRPGKRIVEPGEGEDGGKSPLARHDPADGQRPADPVGRGGRAEVAADAAGRAHVYRVRIRTVDLAGNSVPFSEKELAPPESDLASEAQLAVRFEPVPSPTVLRRHLDTEGESLEHLVIRSNGGITRQGLRVVAARRRCPGGRAVHVRRGLAAPRRAAEGLDADGRVRRQVRHADAAAPAAQ